MGGEWLGARSGPARVLLAVEGEAAAPEAVQLLIAELRSRGHEIVGPPIEKALGRAPSPHGVMIVPVTSDDAARLVIQAAVRGWSVLAINQAPRDVADRLYDDLRRFGRLDVRSVRARPAGDGLSQDERRLLELLAGGMSLGEAASALHLSRRTADRRLATARRALGAATTPEAIARLRTPPAA